VPAGHVSAIETQFSQLAKTTDQRLASGTVGNLKEKWGGKMHFYNFHANCHKSCK